MGDNFKIALKVAIISPFVALALMLNTYQEAWVKNAARGIPVSENILCLCFWMMPVWASPIIGFFIGLAYSNIVDVAQKGLDNLTKK